MLHFPILPLPAKFQTQLHKIEVLSQAIQHIPLTAQAKLNIFHRQLLKSSLFSARIEGNQLTLKSMPRIDPAPHEKSQQEISNVYLALQKIPSWPLPFTEQTILNLHSLVMNQLVSSAGKFRHEASAIFDQFGNIVYLTPEPAEMKQMLKVCLEQTNQQTLLPWQNQLILIAASHYYYEKIHPFIDGNGRTGRVIMHAQLYQTHQFNNLILPLDQYFDDNRRVYYDYLEKNTRLIDPWIEFFLTGLEWSLNQILDDIRHPQNDPQIMTQNLLPRRQEIYLIIKDHPHISLDTIARRFPTIPKRTLANDVNQLLKQQLIIKHGQTRGVVYSIHLD